jgi:cytochrome c biogenesis protein CcmG, thiol:disulfide interchange protein DsbE
MVNTAFQVILFRRIKPRNYLQRMTSTMNTERNIFCLLALAILFSGCNSNDAKRNTNAPVGTAMPKTAFPMPPLSGKALENMGWSVADGKRNLISEFKGKVLVLDFYATWCLPCRESIPHLIDLQKRYENDVRVVGLNVGGPDDIDRVSEFAEEMKIKYSLGVPDNDLTSLLLADADAIPQTFVFDRNGKMVKRFVGYDSTTGEQIDLAVEGALTSSN